MPYRKANTVFLVLFFFIFLFFFSFTFSLFLVSVVLFLVLVLVLVLGCFLVVNVVHYLLTSRQSLVKPRQRNQSQSTVTRTKYAQRSSCIFNLGGGEGP